jgi:hypothetical protein
MMNINQSDSDIQPQNNINPTLYSSIVAESASVMIQEKNSNNSNAPTSIRDNNQTSGFSTKNYIESPEAYHRRKLWCTIIYGSCFLRFDISKEKNRNTIAITK